MNSTIKRLAIQAGIDMEFYPAGELFKFADLIRAEDAKKIAALEKHNYELQFQNNLFVERLLTEELSDAEKYITSLRQQVAELEAKLAIAV